MCIKTIYHNTYSDGDRDVTERVDTCAPGFLCPNPKVRELYRTMGHTKIQVRTSSSSPRRSPTYWKGEHRAPPTPPSPSPPPSRGYDYDSDRKSTRRRSIFADGVKIYNHDSRGNRLPQAPLPPSPRAVPIPITRSSTVPYGMETPPTRGRRPIIIEELAPRVSSDTIPIGPVDVLEHSSRSARRLSRRDSELHKSHRGHTRSPRLDGYASAEDERERHERRRKRRELRTQAAVTPSSVPTYAATDIYASSAGSSNGSSQNSSYVDPPAFPSSAVAAVKKELRWEDEMRAKQNARINSRPKLSRPATPAGGLQGEVKSILKNGGETKVNPTSSRDSSREMDDLRRSVENMGLRRDRESSSQRRAREFQEREDREDKEYQERLRKRFSMPPRRFTMGTGPKRRTEVFYPDEGRYKFL